jgi:hypothetical protein
MQVPCSAQGPAVLAHEAQIRKHWFGFSHKSPDFEGEVWPIVTRHVGELRRVLFVAASWRRRRQPEAPFALTPDRLFWSAEASKLTASQWDSLMEQAWFGSGSGLLFEAPCSSAVFAELRDLYGAGERYDRQVYANTEILGAATSAALAGGQLPQSRTGLLAFEFDVLGLYVIGEPGWLAGACAAL